MSADGPKAASDDWDFYFCNVNDVLSSIMVNLSAIRRAPENDKPWLLWAWVHLLDGRPDGLSSDVEASKLYEIENALTTALKWPCGAELLGRITGGGRREFYCYAPATKGFETAVDKLRSLFPEYRIEYGSKRDADWKQYLQVLYPTEAQMQRIQNRRVLEQLEERGDDHSLPRIVDHLLYFRSASARTAVTLDHINDVVSELIDLATRFDGDYDGWGREVPVRRSTLCQLCVPARLKCNGAAKDDWSVGPGDRKVSFNTGVRYRVRAVRRPEDYNQHQQSTGSHARRF
jgi:hypothetical protein